MGLFDGEVFGSMFDFNGDGNTDIAEEILGYQILQGIFDDDDDDDDELSEQEEYSF